MAYGGGQAVVGSLMPQPVSAIAWMEVGAPVHVFAAPAYLATPRSPVVLPPVHVNCFQALEAPRAFLQPGSFAPIVQQPCYGGHGGDKLMGGSPPPRDEKAEEGFEASEEFKPKVLVSQCAAVDAQRMFLRPMPPMPFATSCMQPKPVAAEASPRDDGSNAVLAGAEGAIEPRDGFIAKVPLPPEAEKAGWSRFEKDLFLQSDGTYHPGKMARRRRLPNSEASSRSSASSTGVAQEVRGRISVVSPTMSSRQHFHEQLWDCFLAQDWPDKELIVLETFEETPSAFLQQKAKEDPRLVLVSFKVLPEKDFTVGLKRDMTLHLASGEFVANFDDDDVYAANYVTSMISQLQRENLIALTFSCWFNFYTSTSTCGYSNERCWEAEDQEELEEVLYGYGFSYVHRRREALAIPYPNIEFAEDAPFMLRFREVFGHHRVGLRRDEEGICMHIVHRSSSCGDPEFSRMLMPSELLELEVAKLPLFRQYLDTQTRSCWLSALPAVSLSMWPFGSSAATARKGDHVSCM